LLTEAHEVVDRCKCPSVWKTAEGRPHCDLCKRIGVALAEQKEST
jgi:hypothetical protein